MDSDESYETTSEAFREEDSEPSSSSSQTSVTRDSSELRELYASTFSGPEHPIPPTTAENQIGLLTTKIKEQTQQIQSLKEERIKYLEKITQLYTELEKRESELVEFIQSYEQKANDVAQYMQEVQGLLSQLTTLFPDQLAESNSTDEFISSGTTSSSATTTSSGNLVSSVTNNGTIGVNKQIPASEKSVLVENQSMSNGSSEQNGQVGWDQRGRALLHALSASVATASARNKQATLPRNTDPTALGSHLPIIEVPPRPATRISTLTSNGSSTVSKVAVPGKLNASTDANSTDGPEVTVCNLPPFCWTTEHVLYWLAEYACLPGGCIAAAKRLQLDGKQLTALSGNKADKLLCLSDAGLRRKFQLALEDLRVHGPPGISRFPGPSHVRPQWICDVWLRHHLGLSQLAPLFAVRRVDGRLLASLTIYKRTSGRTHTGSLTSRNSRGQLISSPSEIIVSPGAGSSLPGTPLPVNGSRNHPNSGLNGQVDRTSGSWRGVSRKEFHRILLGLSRDTSSVGSGGGGVSGADLPPEAKLLLGKREACSLRAGIELLRQYNFNLELLEQTRAEAESNNDNLLVWTNDQVAKWLKDLGLKAFTEGIDGTGLHGAYMVLDPTFDVTRLLKLLHLPASVAAAHKLDEHLQALLKPARQREGIQPKQNSIFRRRSVSRPGPVNLMQRSITSGIPMDYSSASTPLLTSIVGPDRDPRDNGNNGKFCEQHSSGLDCYPQTMPATSMFITTLNSFNPNLSRTLNGTGQLLATPTKVSIGGGTPKRGKFKSVTVGGDLSNSRFTRVFCRGRPTNHSVDLHVDSLEQTAAGLGSPVGGDSSLSGQEEQRTATLVRRTSGQKGSAVNDSIRTAASGKMSTPKSSPRHPGESLKSTPIRGGVKPSEAPMVDPFAPDGGRTRLRVVLGQTPRLITLTASGCTSPPPVVSATATTNHHAPSAALRDPVNSPRTGCDSSHNRPSDHKSQSLFPVNSSSPAKVSARIGITATSEPNPTKSTMSSLSNQSNMAMTNASVLKDAKITS